MDNALSRKVKMGSVFDKWKIIILTLFDQGAPLCIKENPRTSRELHYLTPPYPKTQSPTSLCVWEKLRFQLTILPGVLPGEVLNVTRGASSQCCESDIL